MMNFCASFIMSCLSCKNITSDLQHFQSVFIPQSERRIKSDDKSVTTEKNFMVAPCINNIQHFNFQMTHTTLKNVELLKHFKISKTAPTCFGLQGNHHEGATIST